jgi:hypothetical protein
LALTYPQTLPVEPSHFTRTLDSGEAKTYGFIRVLHLADVA